MKKNVWNSDIHPFTISCARYNAKPFAFSIFGFYSFFWIFWYIIHRCRIFMTWVTSIILHSERFSRGHAHESINQWKFWLSPGLIKNEPLINQRTHNHWPLKFQSAWWQYGWWSHDYLQRHNDQMIPLMSRIQPNYRSSAYQSPHCFLTMKLECQRWVVPTSQL